MRGISPRAQQCAKESLLKLALFFNSPRNCLWVTTPFLVIMQKIFFLFLTFSHFLMLDENSQVQRSIHCFVLVCFSWTTISPLIRSSSSPPHPILLDFNHKDSYFRLFWGRRTTSSASDDPPTHTHFSQFSILQRPLAMISQRLSRMLICCLLQLLWMFSNEKGFFCVSFIYHYWKRFLKIRQFSFSLRSNSHKYCWNLMQSSFFCTHLSIHFWPRPHSQRLG